MSSVCQLGLLALLSAQAPAAQDWLQVDAALVPLSDAGTSIQIGVPFGLRIEARHRPGTIALLPEALGLPDALGERRAARKHERASDDKEERDVYVLELLAFEAGEHEIPGIPLAMGATTAETPAFTVLVASALEADEQLVASSTHPSALEELERMAAASPPPEKVMVPDYTLFWVLGGAALLVIGALVLLRLSGRNKPGLDLGPPPPPPRPAHEVAIEALAQLRADDPLAQGAFKAHYTALSTILRAYVGGRWGFESLELTHDELIDVLRGKKPAKLDLDGLEQLLFMADQVKFAKYVPLAEDGYAALAEAEKIVEATRPAPAPKPEGEA